MAVTISIDALATQLSVTVDQASQALRTATRLVTDYAPEAPDEVQNEAVVRCSGWLLHRSPAGFTETETEVGDFRERVRYPTTQYAALRHSGAMSLLSPYKRRRAGVIG